MAQLTQAPKKTVLVGGRLGRMIGRTHELAVTSVSEAVRALLILFPEAQKSIQSGQYYIFSGKRNLSKDELKDPLSKDVIRIVPVISGRKNTGLFQVIIGVVLIVAGFFTGGQTWGPAMMMTGAAMAVTGAVMMLAPQSAGSSSQDSVTNAPSYAFNGTINTEAQGNCVPLAYGEVICGSCVISGGMWSEDRA